MHIKISKCCQSNDVYSHSGWLCWAAAFGDITDTSSSITGFWIYWVSPRTVRNTRKGQHLDSWPETIYHGRAVTFFECSCIRAVFIVTRIGSVYDYAILTLRAYTILANSCSMITWLTILVLIKEETGSVEASGRAWHASTARESSRLHRNSPASCCPCTNLCQSCKESDDILRLNIKAWQVKDCRHSCFSRKAGLDPKKQRLAWFTQFEYQLTFYLACLSFGLESKNLPPVPLQSSNRVWNNNKRPNVQSEKAFC